MTNMEVEITGELKSPNSATSPNSLQGKQLKQARLPFMLLDTKSPPVIANKKRKLSSEGDVQSSKSPKNPKTSENISPVDQHVGSKKRPLVATKPVNNDEIEVTSSSEAETRADKACKVAKTGSLDVFVKPVVVREESISSTTDVVDLSHDVHDQGQTCKTAEADDDDKVSNESLDESTEDKTLNESSSHIDELASDVNKDKKNSDISPQNAKTPRNRKMTAEMQRKKEEREKERLEKIKRKEEEKAEKERLRKDEKERKDREKEEIRLKKQREKEEKDKERLEKLQVKEEERKKKQEIIDAKNEERRKKEEERKQKEEDKHKDEEEVKKKKELQKNMFTKFFVVSEKSDKQVKKTDSSSNKLFIEFEVKKDMRLAPTTRASMSDTCLLDSQMLSQDCKDTYIKVLKSKSFKPKSSSKTWPIDTECVCLDNEIITKQGKYKLLRFDENHRPEYWGTWRKTSKTISPRNPFKKDQGLFDYEVDSDDEWEEEEPGESLSNSEGEEDKEDEDEDEDDGFFVPHGHLSDDEMNCDDEDVTPELLKQQQKLKQRQWETEQKRSRTSTAIRPVIHGCYWDGDVNEQLRETMIQFQACLLTRKSIETSYTITVPNSSSAKCTSKPEENSNSKRPVPSEAMVDLVRLVHGNLHSIVKIIREFKQFWSQKVQETITSGAVTEPTKADGTTTPVQDKFDSATNTPQTSTPPRNGFISKRQLELKIKEIAVYEKRADFKKKCWYVHQNVIDSLQLGELPVPTQWEYLTNPAARKTESEGHNTPGVTPGKSASIKQFTVTTPSGGASMLPVSGRTSGGLVPVCGTPSGGKSLVSTVSSPGTTSPFTVIQSPPSTSPSSSSPYVVINTPTRHITPMDATPTSSHKHAITNTPSAIKDVHKIRSIMEFAKPVNSSLFTTGAAFKKVSPQSSQDKTASNNCIQKPCLMNPKVLLSRVETPSGGNNRMSPGHRPASLENDSNSDVIVLE